MSRRRFLNKMEDYREGKEFALSENQILSMCGMLLKDIENRKASVEKFDGSLYVGHAGIDFMLLRMLKSPQYDNRRGEILARLSHDLKIGLEFLRKHQGAGDVEEQAFLLGAAGINALGAVVFALSDDQENKNVKEQCIHEFRKAAKRCAKEAYRHGGSDEVLMGRAGYLCGLLWLRRELGEEILHSHDTNAVLNAMLQSGMHYAKSHPPRNDSVPHPPLMYAYYGTEYLGAAHGVSAIIQMFLSFPEFLESQPKAKTLVKETLEYFCEIESPNGNYPAATDEIGCEMDDDNTLVHWCHGAAGVVYMYAKAWTVFGEQKFLEKCNNCAELCWTSGLLKKGPGICHGIAGSAYVFLLLYRLTSERKWLHRAHKFAQFMFSKEFVQGSRRPDEPFSLYEGTAGTVCFLLDLLQPKNAQFPFFDIDL